jgi:adenosylcobyric acid synthase
VRFEALAPPWDALSGLEVQGYEIHTGHSVQHAGMAPGRVALPGGLGWQDARGNVLGVYLHGLFEQPAVLQALFGAGVPTLETVFDRLADVVDGAFATGSLPGLLQC